MSTLKEFYKNFGQTFPLAVVKNAYVKVQGGAEVGPALLTAADEYAEKLAKLPLNYTGYTAVSSIDQIVVYQLKTTSELGLRLASPYADKNSRGLAVARLGENFECDVIAVYTHQPDAVLGSYSQRNRYAVVVRLDCGGVQIEGGMRKKLQGLADALAKNVLAGYPEYLVALHNVQYRKEHKMKYEPAPQWEDFLLSKSLRFVEHVNDEYEQGIWFYTPKWVTIGEYLQNFAQKVGLKLKITEINVFGLNE